MKKIFSILMVVVLILCLSGCIKNENIERDSNNSDIKFWTDTETGIQYVIYSRSAGYAGMGGITPRLNADGTLYSPTEKGGVHE